MCSQRARGRRGDLPAPPGRRGHGLRLHPQHEGEAGACSCGKGQAAAGREVEPAAGAVKLKEDSAERAGFQEVRAGLQQGELVGQDGQQQPFRRQAECGQPRAVEGPGAAFGGLQAKPGDGAIRAACPGDQKCSGGCRRCVGRRGCVEFVQPTRLGGVGRGGRSRGNRLRPDVPRAGQIGLRRLGLRRLGRHICSCFVPNSVFRCRSQVRLRSGLCALDATVHGQASSMLRSKIAQIHGSAHSSRHKWAKSPGRT